MKAPKPLFKLLHGSSEGLSRLLAHARRLAAIGRTVDSVLGHPLADHCRVSNLRGNILVVQADSPAWAARLRYRAPALLATLRAPETLPELRNIQIKIIPQTARPGRGRATRQIRMSASTARLIDTVAASMDDPTLQSALRRLASRNRPKDD